MSLYRLSPSADADLMDILQYTYETWGEHQLENYAKGLEGAFRQLAEQPELGRARSEWDQAECAAFAIVPT